MKQPMSSWAVVVSHLFLARVPILGLFALIALGFFGLCGPSTLTNMMLMGNLKQLALSAFFACLFASLCGLLLLTIWKLAEIRFQVRPLKLPSWLDNATAYRGFVAQPAALILIAALGLQNTPEEDGFCYWYAALAIAAGILAAALVIVLIEKVRGFFVRKLLPSLQRRVKRPLTRPLRVFGPGFYDEGQQGLQPGQALAFTTLGILISFYIGGYFGLEPSLEESPQLAPTLVYILGWFMLLVSFFSGVSFYLDRYRVPVLLGLLAGLIILGFVAPKDHYFSVKQLETDPPEAVQALQARLDLQRQGLRDEKPVLTVVAASGGGIQAAAWTAQVLTGLQERFGEDFTRSIYLVSSVSGGSAGLFHYLHGFDPEQAAPDRETLASIREAAKASSLEATAWGLIYPDFLRAFFPFFVKKHKDRAWAMERAWLRNAKQQKLLPEDLGENGPWLSDWMKGTREGWLPSVVFNSTIVEDGRQLQLATFDVAKLRADNGPKDQDLFEPPRGTAPRSLTDVSGNLLDLPTVTAARLSSTFPFVTPVARPQWDDKGNEKLRLARFHAADGGYFDNQGVVSAIEWILAMNEEEVLDQFSKIVFIQVNAFPEPCESSGQSREAGLLSWLESTTAPARTLEKVRTSSQLWRNSLELQALIGTISDDSEDFENENSRPSKVLPVVIQPPQDCKGPGANPPLSWYLSEKDKKWIEKTWEELEMRFTKSEKYPAFEELEKLFQPTSPTAPKQDNAA
ncbi:MAG: hypothetical protein SX243_01640 [Acidobacteriota bacterium]|nr:hypothetical protein [Acidobacteriota bacterium]